MKRFIRSKKGIALVTLVVAAVAAVAAWAYFTGSGSGTGSAQTATPASLQISQIGAGYDSLVPSNSNDPYHQDQCFACASITAFGNDITLANPGSQRLTSAVVAFRNWGPAFSGVPITLSIVGGPSSTVSPHFAAVQGNGRPTVTNVTFPFNNLVNQEFVYKISFDPSPPADSLNVALSSSANNLSVGTDTHPGTVWVMTGNSSVGNTFPPCSFPVTTGTFVQVTTNCGPSNSNEPGAYGNNVNTSSTDADIPAVEFNVVGGIVPVLYPGGPSQPIDFAITNPGSSSVYVNNVAITASSLHLGPQNGSLEDCTTAMYPIVQPTINANIPTGTSFFSPSGASISMHDDGNNQDNCQGATVNLGFTASGS